MALVWNSYCLYEKKRKEVREDGERKERKVKGRRGEVKEDNRQEGQKGETENLKDSLLDNASRNFPQHLKSSLKECPLSLVLKVLSEMKFQ